MNKQINITAALFGIIAIILGAFCAHLFKKYLTINQLTAFETGVKYQIYHAFFLFYIGITTITEKVKKTIYYLTLFGVLCFSGSIYLLTTQSISGIDFKFIGLITPFGGLLLIGAWTVLLVNFIKEKA